MKLLRRVLIALLISLLVGFAIGLVIRVRLERPVRYIASAAAPDPLDIADAPTPVFYTGDHEEQIG